MESGVIHCKQTNTITLYNIIIMKRLLLLISLLCALCAQAQTYWNGTADKNFPGEGTEASPYLISTPEQLAGLAERTNVDKEDFAGKYIKLTQDIYLTDLSQEGETRKQWTPIGDVFYGNYSIDPESGEIISPERQEALFCGHFDGDDHTIYNLYYVPVDDCEECALSVSKVIVQDVPEEYDDMTENQVKSNQGFSYAVFSNSSNGSINVTYSLETKMSLSIELADLFGKKVKTILPKQKQQAGSYSLQIPISDFSSGTCFLTISSSNLKKTAKIFINK